MFIAFRQTSNVAGLGSSFRLGMRRCQAPAPTPVPGAADTKIFGNALIFQFRHCLATGGTGENSNTAHRIDNAYFEIMQLAFHDKKGMKSSEFGFMISNSSFFPVFPMME